MIYESLPVPIYGDGRLQFILEGTEGERVRSRSLDAKPCR